MGFIRFLTILKLLLLILMNEKKSEVIETVLTKLCPCLIWNNSVRKIKLFNHFTYVNTFL